MHYVALSIEWIIFSFLSIQVGYLFFFSVMGKLGRKKVFPKAAKLRSIRVFIPAYKEDSVIIDTARAALAHDYPSHLFEVIVIADSFSEQTLKTLNVMGVKVIVVSFEKSTKGKALQKAIEATASNVVDIVVVHPKISSSTC